MEQTTNNIEEFYSQPFFFSYSSLKLLLWCPQAFKEKYIDKKSVEKIEKHLVNGKLIHCLLLDDSAFRNNFILSPTTVPTGNTKLVVDRVFRHFTELSASDDIRGQLQEFDGAILDILLDMDLHQNLKTDVQRVAKIITDDTVAYFNFLKDKGNKTIVDVETLTYCRSIVDSIKENNEILELMGLDSASQFDSDITVDNEKELRITLATFNFGIKGILDNIVIDKTNNIIRINDLKCTSKPLTEFTDSVEFYSYWLQAVIYHSLIIVHYRDLISSGYKVEFRFIVVDSFGQIYPFLVTPSTLSKWSKQFKEWLIKADYHYTKREYHLPYEFLTKQVVL